MWSPAKIRFSTNFSFQRNFSISETRYGAELISRAQLHSVTETIANCALIERALADVHSAGATGKADPRLESVARSFLKFRLKSLY
jgi:hypothetical protein